MKQFLDTRLKKRAILIFAVTIVVILVAILQYMHVIKDTVRENIVEEIGEIVNLDRDNIQSGNDMMWALSGQLSKRICSNEYSTLQSLCDELNAEYVADYFDSAFLVDDRGMTYSSTCFIENKMDREPVKKILAGEKKFVVKNYDESISEKYTDSLIYGISFEPLTVEEVTFIGLYAVVDSHVLEKKIHYDIFSGEGYSAVFDSNGYYVVKKDISKGVSRRQSFYTDLSTDYGYTNNMNEALKTRINSGKSFAESLKNGNREKVLMQFEPIEDTDWTLVVVVPRAAINRRTQFFVRQALVTIVIVLAIIITVMSIVVKTASNVISAKADAKARSEFLATMSHEIRTPLNGIIGLNHLMQAHINEKEKLMEYLKKSADTEQYLLSSINDILDVQKIEAGKMDIIEEPFSISAMILSIEDIIRHRMESKQIYFSVEKNITDDFVIGDQTRIQQILLNILSNAQKFTAEHGNVEFVINQQPGMNREVVTTYTVTDDGCGMTKEFQDRIFDSFSQERHELKDSLKGTGLGMNISYLLSHKMGGDLSVDSVLGEGSRFTLVLRSRIVDPVFFENNIASKTADNVEPEKSLHILVAEDDELNAEIMMDVLEINGHRGELAVDGEEVVRKFEESPEYTYDLILMDVQMPKLSGYEATKKIRQMNRQDAKDITIYACTANVMLEDLERAKEAGMNEFIAKPVDINKMMEMFKQKG